MFFKLKSRSTIGYAIITTAMLDLFMALYFLHNDINGYLILFQLWLDQYVLLVGGVGVNGNNVVLLGSISLLVFGVGLGGWYYWKRILPIAGAISIGKVSTVLDSTILENSWQCGHCGLRFKIGQWGKTVIMGGVLAGNVIYTCPNCKKPIKSDRVPQGDKEPTEIIDLSNLQKVLLLREKEPQGPDEFGDATPQTKEEAVNDIVGVKNEPEKKKDGYVECPDCGSNYLERGLNRHRASHKKKPIKAVTIDEL